MNERIEKLIVKFLTKEANFDELQQLESWISNPKNEILFFQYIDTNAYIKITMSKYDKKRATENIVSRIKQEKSVFYKRFITKAIYKYTAAAVFIGILTTAYLFRDSIQ